MAIENGVQNAELGYILDPAFQIENINGKPAVGGHIEIFEAGTDNKYISYQNFDGAQNPFKIPLGADGRAVILGDPSLSYDVYAYDSYNNLMFSRLNVQCNVPGTINLSGADTRIKNTDGTLDISLRTLGNNVRQYIINTHNKVLDVQSPLYFVENSETATVIGFSGDGYLTEDKFEYDDNSNITGYDGSAFAGRQSGPTYSAGDYVNITDDTISVTGLQPSGNYASASDVTALEEKLDDKLDVSAFNESAVTVNNFQYEGDKITAYNNSAFAGADYEAGQYVDITDNRISVTGVQPSGNYASASDVTELNNKLADKLDTSAAFTKASADTLYQPIGEYAPTGDYAYKSDLNVYQPASSMTAYATTALVSSVSSTITGMIPTGDYELVAGEGVELVDDPTAKTTTINVTAEGTPVTAIEQMIESATSGLQPSGDYATTAELANKLDTTAFSDVSGTFLTAHQDISNKLDTTAFSDVSGSFLTAVPDTYLQNTDLATADGKVTAISGIPLSAGGDVPEGVMSESGLEYNAVNEISGYNGSAIAQYGAEKQWLVHDDTLVHAANSAQYALGVNLSALQRLMGVDETVLWEGDLTLTAGQTSSFTVNENISAFNSIRVYSKPSYGVNDAQCIMMHEEAPFQGVNTNWTFFTEMDYPKIHGTASIQFDMNNLTIINNAATYYGYGRGRVSGYQLGFERNDRGAALLKIVGIGRKQ